jgi:hypothetical protein
VELHQAFPPASTTDEVIVVETTAWQPASPAGATPRPDDLSEWSDDASGSEPSPLLETDLSSACEPPLSDVARPAAALRRNRNVVPLSHRAMIGLYGGGSASLFAIILLVFPKLGAFLSVLLFLAGVAVFFTGVCWQLYCALRESTACFVWSLIFVPYGFVYTLSRWEKTRKPFAVMLGGVVLCLAATAAFAYAKKLIVERSGASAVERNVPSTMRR